MLFLKPLKHIFIMQGGGVRIYDGTVLFENCNISSNTAIGVSFGAKCEPLLETFHGPLEFAETAVHPVCERVASSLGGSGLLLQDVSVWRQLEPLHVTFHRPLEFPETAATHIYAGRRGRHWFWHRALRELQHLF